MSTTHTRAKRLLVTAIGAAVLGISVAAAPAAIAEKNAPNPADEDFITCPSGRDGVVAGTATSCAFADDVRTAWLGQPGNPVIAYSPVTDQTYRMFCVGNKTVIFTDGHSADAVECVGGNDAEVVVW
jgi:uncharacterized membrane protein